MLNLKGKNNFLSYPLIRLWQNIPLPLQGKILVALPLLAVIISAALAIFGNYQRAQIESAIQHHYRMVAYLDEVLTLMVNAETGMRGYLLTRREEFLEPYKAASQNIPTTLSQVRVLAESEQRGNVRLKKLGLVNRLQELIHLQMSDLSWQEHHATLPIVSKKEIFDHLRLGKQFMDEIRANLNALQTAERHILFEQLAEISAIRKRDFIAIFLTLIVGIGTRLIAWYLFNTGVIRRIKHLKVNIRALRQGYLMPYTPSGKPDALGELEQEIMFFAEEHINS